MKTPDTINGKTPEEIKKGLECCGKGSCLGCPYRREEHCVTKKNDDVNAYIQQLESRLVQAERERYELFMYLPHDCTTCRFELTCERSDECNCGEFWQWRGICPKNTKENK